MPTALLPVNTRNFQPRLLAPGELVTELADIDQCIRVILTTPKGAVPLRPRFGSDVWKYLDMPVSEARAWLARAVHEALDEWEPRARLVRVDITDRGVAAGGIGLVVEWRTADSVRITNFSTGDFSGISGVGLNI